jgi:hypothetical protein
MTKYLYTGPQTAFTVGKTDYQLHPDAVIDLDETNSYVQRLVSQGRLHEQSATAATTAATTAALVQTIAPAVPPTESIQPDSENAPRTERSRK